jgi:hypothetical protein
LRVQSDGGGQVLVIKWVWVGGCKPEGTAWWGWPSGCDEGGALKHYECTLIAVGREHFQWRESTMVMCC